MKPMAFTVSDVLSLGATLLALAATYWRIRERLTAVETKLDGLRREVTHIGDRINGHVDDHAKGDIK